MSTIEPQLGAHAYADKVLSAVDEELKIVEVSGGHDSTMMLYEVANSDQVEIDAVFHMNTGIGAEFTRQYVREHCARLGLPYIEGIQPDPDQRYGPKVIVHGFPGARPIAHEMHRRDLKQDVEDKLIAAYDKSIAIITGANRYESARRKRNVAKNGIQESSRHSDVTNYGPIAEWTGSEIKDGLKEYGVDRNELADLLDSSGECLCGAFASFWDLGIIAKYHPTLFHAIMTLMLLASLYWSDFRQEHGRPPYPRQYLIWGHGGVGKGALSEMVEGSLDDPADFSDSEIEQRAEQAEKDDDQLDLESKCSSCVQKQQAAELM